MHAREEIATSRCRLVHVWGIDKTQPCIDCLVFADAIIPMLAETWRTAYLTGWDDLRLARKMATNPYLPRES